MLQIPDNDPVGVASAIAIAESGTVVADQGGVRHRAYLHRRSARHAESPTGRRAVLHAQLGGSTDNLIATYDSATPGELAGLVGQPMQGHWVLSVVDRAAQDVGVLQKWRLEITSAAVGEAPVWQNSARRHAPTRAIGSPYRRQPALRPRRRPDVRPPGSRTWKGGAALVRPRAPAGA